MLNETKNSHRIEKRRRSTMGVSRTPFFHLENPLRIQRLAFDGDMGGDFTPRTTSSSEGDTEAWGGLIGLVMDLLQAYFEARSENKPKKIDLSDETTETSDGIRRKFDEQHHDPRITF